MPNPRRYEVTQLQAPCRGMSAHNVETLQSMENGSTFGPTKHTVHPCRAKDHASQQIHFTLRLVNRFDKALKIDGENVLSVWMYVSEDTRRDSSAAR